MKTLSRASEVQENKVQLVKTENKGLLSTKTELAVLPMQLILKVEDLKHVFARSTHHQHKNRKIQSNLSQHQMFYYLLPQKTL